ncbi:MAG: adenylate/guanylate cyclase domain-containing protein [Blastopirellula sp.]|nr:adenylate/guanylate cyclase domain-containing protein [Blastopirellula sp.]MAR08762.1 adenylate/guanylate cyclase domain-containing protein [Blastopirellula sp.]
MNRAAQLIQRVAPLLVALIILIVLRTTGLAQTIDLVLYDLITTHREARDGKETPITLITITESDIKRFGWPIDDGLLCQALDRLLADNVRAIGLDLYRDQGVGPNQECLRKRFRNEAKLVSIFNAVAGIEAIPGTPPERQSFNDLSLDSDGILRRDLVHVGEQDEATVSFAMRVMEVATGDTKLRQAINSNQLIDAWLSANAGGYHNAIDAKFGWQRMLHFRKPGSFRQYSLAQLLDGMVPSQAIDNKIILIGSTAQSLRDLFEVPHSRFHYGAEPFQISGVEIHANRIASLLDHRDNKLPIGWIMPGWGNIVLIFIYSSCGLLLGEAIPSLRRSVQIVSLLAISLTAGLLLLHLHQYVWIGTALPLAGLLSMSGSAWVRRGVISQQHSQQIRRLLGQATSPAVAQQLWNQREELLSSGRFEGQQLPITVLFTDTAGFTSISERLSPRELMQWLNRGIAICVRAVTSRGGMVNKFTGDGMLAVFGVPVQQNTADEAKAAFEAAIEIHAGLKRLNQELEDNGEPALRMRVGIHSGEALVGSMGSAERIEYAVIGDTVNCASRLESLDKKRHEGVLRVLVSDDTLNLLDPSFRDTVSRQSWGTIHVKGREKPLEVNELILDN